jgi:hypothetical protein
MRFVAFFTISSLSVAACGGDDGGSMPDAAIDIGFNPPTVTLKANDEVAEDSWMEVGPADLSCLGTPSADVASTVAVTLNTKVTDFQSGNAVPNAKVEVFKDQNYMTVENTATSDTSANVTLMLPVGVKRFGYRMTSSSSLPTFLLNQTLTSPSEPTQMVGEIQSVSNATAATLPALIGQTRTLGTGVVAGALRDCQKREISGFIATMSATPATANTVPGADTYYFDSAVGLPVHHNRQKYASHDGLFMIIEVPSTNPTGYVQMWGFPTDADLAMGMAGLKLIAELQVPILADTVITGSYEPLRQ